MNANNELDKEKLKLLFKKIFNIQTNKHLAIKLMLIFTFFFHKFIYSFEGLFYWRRITVDPAILLFRLDRAHVAKFFYYKRDLWQTWLRA